jgi:hypothetical protein
MLDDATRGKLCLTTYATSPLSERPQDVFGTLQARQVCDEPPSIAHATCYAEFCAPPRTSRALRSHSLGNRHYHPLASTTSALLSSAMPQSVASLAQQAKTMRVQVKSLSDARATHETHGERAGMGIDHINKRALPPAGIGILSAPTCISLPLSIYLSTPSPPPSLSLSPKLYGYRD